VFVHVGVVVFYEHALLFVAVLSRDVYVHIFLYLFGCLISRFQDVRVEIPLRVGLTPRYLFLILTISK
jgi:hypothetical protein